MMVRKGTCSSNISLEWQGKIVVMPCNKTTTSWTKKMKMENHSYTTEIYFYYNSPLYPPLSFTEERWILEEFAQME